MSLHPSVASTPLENILACIVPANYSQFARFAMVPFPRMQCSWNKHIPHGQFDRSGTVDVLGAVCQLRQDRGFTVQTADQYAFIHRVSRALRPPLHPSPFLSFPPLIAFYPLSPLIFPLATLSLSTPSTPVLSLQVLLDYMIFGASGPAPAPASDVPAAGASAPALKPPSVLANRRSLLLLASMRKETSTEADDMTPLSTILEEPISPPPATDSVPTIVEPPAASSVASGPVETNPVGSGDVPASSSALLLEAPSSPAPALSPPANDVFGMHPLLRALMAGTEASATMSLIPAVTPNIR
jgi:hypothetical protein